MVARRLVKIQLFYFILKSPIPHNITGLICMCACVGV